MIYISFSTETSVFNCVYRILNLVITLSAKNLFIQVLSFALRAFFFLDCLYSMHELQVDIDISFQFCFVMDGSPF